MIGRRYQILDELGSGGMGTVYRAYDRLGGWQVALKQVNAPASEISFAGGRRRITETLDSQASEEQCLALAREFRLLSSLRHPNIISVLDYGFDDDRRPFYTMEVLDEPQTLLEAGEGQPLPTQVDLLLQTLHALAYLHRRGVIHRDIKPSNVLVEKRKVKLLDFGISEMRGRTKPESGVSGSVPYLAPEVLQQQPFNESADLYSLGVIAYELLAGRHPYADESLAVMMMKAAREAPVLSTSDVDGRVIPVLQRLLAIDPTERYTSADEVIRDLTRAANLPLPEETSEIRDSYLKAARLVGRDRELQKLTGLVKEAIAGRGNVILVSGEGGVGKSRLLDELRAVCLVEGAPVLNGHAVGTHGGPYHMWRAILRWLCLLVEVDNHSASVLKPLVPDVEELLGRPVDDPDEVDPQGAQFRFFVTVENLFRRLDQPVVVVLEDFHRALSTGVQLLARLQQVVSHLPIFIVAAFRDDERPELVSEIPGALHLRLERLDAESIAELSESMLGEAGRRPEILELLQRETEGNALFLVEVVRALAEEVGGLAAVAHAPLPEQISAGSIDRILGRRLGRVPRSDRALLRQAAVFGRELDLKLLEALAEGKDLDRWLKTCGDAAVLEVHDGVWRLTNERLRERLLHDMAASELRAAHRRAAETIAAVHGEGPQRIGALAHHWREAADVADPEATARAVDYLERAGAAAMAQCFNEEAEELLTEGLKLLGTLPSTPERQRQEIRIQVDLGATYLMSKGFTAPEVGQAFGRAKSLCEETGETAQLVPALLGLWRFYIVRGELDTTRELAEQMLDHAVLSNNMATLMVARYVMGTTLLFPGETEAAWAELKEAIELYERLHTDSQREVAASSFFLGQNPGVAAYDYASWALWCLGYPDTAMEKNRLGLRLADKLKHPFSQSFARTLVIWIHILRRDDDGADAAAEESVTLAKAQGFPYFLAVSSVFKGWAMARKGKVEEGIALIEQILDGLRASGSELFRPFFMSLLAEAYGLAQRPADGLEATEEALENLDRRGGGWWEPEIHRLRGELFLALPEPDREQAENAFLKALHTARFRKERTLELRASMSLLKLWRDDEERSSKARATLEALYESFDEGFETADLVEAKRLL